MAALEAGLALAQMLFGLGAQQDQKALSWANLNETKRSNRSSEKLAKSARKDANGNIVQYNEATNEWETVLSPTSKQILEAENAETLASLTQDAPRNRRAAERMDERSIMADDEFEKVFNEYRFRPETSEAEYISDAQNTLLGGKREGLDEAASMLARQLIRSGNSGEIEGIYKSFDDNYADGLAEMLLQGKNAGKQMFLQNEGGKDAKAQQELGFLGNIANGTTTSPVASTNIDRELAATAEGSLGQLLSTLSSNNAARQGAMNGVIQTAGLTPDFSALIKVLSDWEDEAAGTTGATNAPYPRPREEGMLARQRAYNGF